MVENQQKAAEETLFESEVRYNNAMLVQEIGQATSTIMDISKLIATVMGIIEKRLEFDRGIIMLADKGTGIPQIRCRLWTHTGTEDPPAPDHLQP